MTLNIVVACDHRGYEAKRRLVPTISNDGANTVIDVGCGSTEPVDYPDFALAAAQKILSGEATIGILLDNSGIGMSIAANRIKGIRAALAHDVVTARIARAHNHCNVLCLGVDLLSDEQMKTITQIFLSTEFETGRHARRVAKVEELGL